jgi:hypothetical protein
MDCAICHSTLGFADFVHGCEEDREESPEVFRLRCGHAFHNGCLCRSLRNDAGCPMCRGTLTVVAANVEEQQLRIVVDADGLLTIRTEDVEEEDIAETTFNLEEARVVSESLNTVGRISYVQKARARVNVATKEYRKMEHTLFRARAAFLKSAIDDFRKTWRSPFEKVRKNLKRKLKSLKTIETEEVFKVLPDVNLDSYINYDVEPHVGNKDTFGPLKHTFWKH